MRLKPLVRKRTLTDIRSRPGLNGCGYPFRKKNQARCEQQRLSVPKNTQLFERLRLCAKTKKNNHTAVRLLLQFVYKNHSTVQMAKGIRFSKGWYYPFRMNLIQLSD